MSWRLLSSHAASTALQDARVVSCVGCARVPEKRQKIRNFPITFASLGVTRSDSRNVLREMFATCDTIFVPVALLEPSRIRDADFWPCAANSRRFFDSRNRCAANSRADSPNCSIRALYEDLRSTSRRTAHFKHWISRTLRGLSHCTSRTGFHALRFMHISRTALHAHFTHTS